MGVSKAVLGRHFPAAKATRGKHAIDTGCTNWGRQALAMCQPQRESRLAVHPPPRNNCRLLPAAGSGGCSASGRHWPPPLANRTKSQRVRVGRNRGKATLLANQEAGLPWQPLLRSTNKCHTRPQSSFCLRYSCQKWRRRLARRGISYGYQSAPYALPLSRTH